jgi:two-component system, response regulator YesN
MEILMIDDDRVSIDILAEYIKPHLINIKNIVCCYDGNEAMDVILSSKPAIIITDIRMPVLNGIELIKRVRATCDYEPKIIIISGYNEFEYARSGIEFNVSDYILKPIDPDVLIDKINKLSQSVETKIDIVKNESVFDKIQQFITFNLGNDLKLNDISKHFHYNSAYLGRLIKSNTSMSFNEYLLKLRVIKAKSLLSNTTLSINQVSNEVGFKDSEYFTKRFKKSTGYTPSEYRNKKN